MPRGVGVRLPPGAPFFKMSLLITLTSLIVSIHSAFADDVAVCINKTEIVDHRKVEVCDKAKGILCDNEAIYGQKFPVGSKVEYLCEFNNEKLIKSVNSVKVLKETPFFSEKLSTNSVVRFNSEEKIYITFGEKQEFYGKNYGKGVHAFFKNKKPYSVDGKPPFEFDGMLLKSVFFFEDGNFERLSLYEDTEIQGYTFKANTEVRFHKNGNIDKGELAKAHKHGPWNIIGKTLWHENGQPSQSNLDSIHPYQNTKLHKEIRFDKKGRIEMGTMAEPASRYNELGVCVRWKVGDRAGFGKNGARLWSKWYPEHASANVPGHSCE